MAGETEAIRQPEIDWEIKGASLPFDGLQELSNEFGLGPLTQRPPHIEIVAYNVEAIDIQKSKVSGTNADIHVLLAKGLLHDHLTLGYRIYMPGVATTRAIVSGTAMDWTEEDQIDRGRVMIQIPVAAVLNCTVSYNGIVQTHYWLSYPDKSQMKLSIRDLKLSRRPSPTPKVAGKKPGI